MQHKSLRCAEVILKTIYSAHIGGGFSFHFNAQQCFYMLQCEIIAECVKSSSHVSQSASTRKDKLDMNKKHL